MFGLGAGELLLVALFALIFIGPKKLPELAKGLGKGIREFQKAKDEIMTQVQTPELDEDDMTQKKIAEVMSPSDSSQEDQVEKVTKTSESKETQEPS